MFQNRQTSGSTILTGAALLSILLVYVLYLSAFKSGYGAFGDSYEYGAFSYHPVVMSSAFVFLGPLSSLVYVVLENICGIPHRAAKVIHGTLHGVALVLGIVGIKSMFYTHDSKGMGHFQSLHSLVGIFAIAIYGLQFLGGFLVFGLNVLSPESRKSFLFYHRFFGAAISLTSVLAILLGSLSLVWRGHESGVKCPSGEGQGFVSTGSQFTSVNTAGFSALLSAFLTGGCIVASRYYTPELSSSGEHEQRAEVGDPLLQHT